MNRSQFKQVKCQSGITGIQYKLQDNYSSMEEFLYFSETCGISERLGYANAHDLWRLNPLIESSVNPSDLKIVNNN